MLAIAEMIGSRVHLLDYGDWVQNSFDPVTRSIISINAWSVYGTMQCSRNVKIMFTWAILHPFHVQPTIQTVAYFQCCRPQSLQELRILKLDELEEGGHAAGSALLSKRKRVSVVRKLREVATCVMPADISCIQLALGPGALQWPSWYI